MHHVLTRRLYLCRRLHSLPSSPVYMLVMANVFHVVLLSSTQPATPDYSNIIIFIAHGRDTGRITSLLPPPSLPPSYIPVLDTSTSHVEAFFSIRNLSGWHSFSHHSLSPPAYPNRTNTGHESEGGGAAGGADGNRRSRDFVD